MAPPLFTAALPVNVEPAKNANEFSAFICKAPPFTALLSKNELPEMLMNVFPWYTVAPPPSPVPVSTSDAPVALQFCTVESSSEKCVLLDTSEKPPPVDAEQRSTTESITLR